MSNYCDINDRQFYTCIALYMVSVISCTYSVRWHTWWCTHMKWVQDRLRELGTETSILAVSSHLPLSSPYPGEVVCENNSHVPVSTLLPDRWLLYMERQCITRWGKGFGSTGFHKQLGAGLIHSRNILCVVQSTYKLLCLRNGLFS